MTIMPTMAEFDFAAATSVVNAWRGRCIAAFARVEPAATETLIRLRQTDPNPSVPLLVGQRFSTLAAALDEKNDSVARDAAIALARFRERDELRSFLCHGDAKITIDRNGRWQAVLVNTADETWDAHRTSSYSLRSRPRR